MTNHVHLILDPCNDALSIGLLMKRLAGRQTRYVNHLEKRSGSLWVGRYKSSPIQTETYLLACNRYVELNPVRAGIVERVEDYTWSSYRQKVGLENKKWVDEEPICKNKQTNGLETIQDHKEYISESIPEEEQQIIRGALQRGQLSGSHRFIEEVEKRLGVRVESRRQGRPGQRMQNREEIHV